MQHENNSNYGKQFPQNEGAENPTPQNKNLLYIIIGFLCLAIIGLLIYFIGFNNKQKQEFESEVNAVMVSPHDSIDSLNTIENAKPIRANEGEDEYYEEGEYGYGESFVIGSETNLRSAPQLNSSNVVKEMKFGDRVYRDYSFEDVKFSRVYLSKPAENNTGNLPAYYIASSHIVYSYDFDRYKKSFSLEPFKSMFPKIKSLIINNSYSDGTSYELTQNAERAKQVFAKGDFDQDGLQDFAIILDNNEKQYSRLMIFCNNKAADEPYMAYAMNFSDKVRINSFKKGAKIIMSSDGLEPSPIDGIIVNGENDKYAMVYDRSSQKFKTFYQE